MRIVMIGAGRLATNLATALYAAGHQIMMVYSRTSAAAQELASRVEATATSQLEELPMQADAFIIAVADNALDEVARKAVVGRESQTFFHTAGTMPLRVLACGAKHYGVFYPMQSFSKERIANFQDIPLFLETNDDIALQTAQSLAESLTSHVYHLSSEERQYLHVAAVFACNFANHCYAMAREVLQSHGIDFRVMLPLIDETAQKVHQLSPEEAQTGPAVRHDDNVVAHHIQLLQSHPELAKIYEMLSGDIQRTTKKT